jgi:hypothetical protein
MSTAYLVVTLVGAAMAEFSAGSAFVRAKWVVQAPGRLRRARLVEALGAARAAGAVGC